MNNSELIDRLKQFIATNRFSDARKLSLTEFIGKQYRISGIILRVNNTTGYLRQQSLRKGKTIILRLDGSENVLSIRCTHSCSIHLADHDLSKPFIITATITGYDEVRQLLQAEQLGDITSSNITNEVSSTAINEDIQSHTVVANEDDEFLSEIQQMQLESQRRLSEVADDINKAQSRNLPLVHPEAEHLAAYEPKEPTAEIVVESSIKKLTPRSTPSRLKDNQALNDSVPNPESTEHGKPHQAVEVASSVDPTTANPLTETTAHKPQRPDVVEEETSTSELDVEDDNETQTNTPRLDQLRRTILGDQQSPILQKDFDQIVALETGVPIEKVKEIHRNLWHTVMSPSMFGEQREIFNFFPFGDFRLMRSRDVVNMDFKSAPVPQLTKHDAVEEYPHSNFDGSDTASIHPPIATHAVRIAATVAPLVGLSPPVTYDVIFETLQLLLKVFRVGKRRVRFTDVGEFFPVLLRGTLQYHFRPYRPLIRFATESFRGIISLAEHEGDGQLAFKADKGVPDRTLDKRKYPQPLDRPKKEKNTQLGCIILILAFLGFQFVLALFD